MMSENVLMTLAAVTLVLLNKRLRHRGDAGVADAFAALLALLGVGVTHKVGNTRCETTISETDF
jgi:hypothetical protein